MRSRIRRFLVGSGLVAGVVAAVVFSDAPLGAQARDADATRKAASLRLPDGRPDLQGQWSFATVTPLERPREFADRAVLTADEAARLEERAVRDRFVDRPPPPGNPGAYNRFWVDFGTEVVATNRTSLVVDPPDGRVPPLTEHGMQREETRAARRKIAAGPEDLPVWDRCIVGFNAGPPILPSGYNNNMQLFQTADHVVILTEMVHDARIIPLDGRPPFPAHVRQWRGDSRGRWEGETLVVETRNFRSEGTGTLPLDREFARRGLGLSGDENLRLVERFRAVDADTLLYEFTIDDPTIWTRPWTVSMTMRRSPERMYEYACHEGNYGMTGILSGARADERAGAGEPPADAGAPQKTGPGR
jgi:hypothetical protein